jgi:predicted lysophospholipase L1 biosynthesis ABC-type transport system permease subunit
VLSAISAMAIVILTLIGATVDSPTVSGICFAAAFFAALFGIAAGVFAHAAARRRDQRTSLGLAFAVINLVFGLGSAGVFIAVAISNSQ